MLLQQPVLLATIVITFIFLIVFVWLPMIKVVQLCFVDQSTGAFTLDGFRAIFSRGSTYLASFKNTMLLGVIVSICATALGFLFAFGIMRTEMPGKGFFRFMALMPMITPPFTLSLAIILLFGRSGLITKSLLGITNSNVYGLHSLIVVQTITLFPIAYMTMSGILESIDDSVEDAAFSMGATRGEIFRTVTLPLALPGIASSILITFVQSIEDFSNPSVIGGNFSTLAVDAYLRITSMYDTTGGAILAVALLLPALTAFAIRKAWINKKTYVTVTGKPTQIRRKIYEKHIVAPITAACILFSLVLILLYGTVVCGAFVKTWGVNNTFTLENFTYVFTLGWSAIRNSIELASIAAPLSGILGMIIAYLVVRQRFYGRRLMDFSSMMVFAIPGTVIGIGYIYTFNSRPLLLTGTAFIIIMAFTFRAITIGIESGTSTLMQIDKSIDEASIILGADAGATFRKITLPLLREPFFSGLSYAFLRSITAVSMIIFLVSPRWNLATSRLYSLIENSKFSTAAAYILVLMIIIAVAIVLINLVVNALFMPKYLKKPRRRKKEQGA